MLFPTSGFLLFFLAVAAAMAVLDTRFAAKYLISAAADRARQRLTLGVAVALHLGLLGVFKYFDFFVGSANELAQLLGLEHELPFIEILLPVGISFFTF